LIFSTILFIYSPKLLYQTCVEVPDRLLLRFPKDFKNCFIVFKSEVDVIAYEIALHRQKDERKPTIIKTVVVDEKRFSLTISNPWPQSVIINQSHVMVKVFRQFSVPLEIRQVRMNGKKIPLKRFFDENLKVMDKSYVDREYMREYISLVLLKHNDSVSNYLLTFFCLSLILLIGQLLFSSFRLYFYSDQRLEKYIKEKYPTFQGSKQEINICFGEDLERKDRWFRFLQILGPAFGFILTISSLIVALHPSLQVTPDIKKFFQAIQIAMVSTFVGLLIRIIAIFLQRINNKIFLRADDLFPFK